MRRGSQNSKPLDLLREQSSHRSDNLARDIARYAERRKHGGIRYQINSRGTPRLKVTLPVRQTAVHRDLTPLRTMLRWARTVVTSDGQRRWLEMDPLESVRFEKERSPKRPLASHERYETTVKGVRQLAANEAHQRGRLRWVRLESAVLRMLLIQT